MDSIGAEVGQKMRSAIKAKLMELDCYVDDELPDYIMVMVANRRTKSQMNEDLNLFLSTKTSAFVNWLHIVLKKLKEVTVTNPEVYKKAIKRKSNTELPDDKNSLKVKKEKGHKKVKKELLSDKPEEEAPQESSSITDDLPISSNKMSDNRRIIVTKSADNIVDDNFDIPLLSEVTESANEQELQDIERKIRNVKSRLGILVDSDNEEGTGDIKSENDKSVETPIQNKKNALSDARQISILNDEIAGSVENRDAELKRGGLEDETNSPSEKPEKKLQHKRITFENNLEPSSVKSRLFQDGLKERLSDKFRDKSPARNNREKRPSILDRLGKRSESVERSEYRHSSKHNSSRDKERPNRLSERLGIDKRKTSNHSRSRDRSPLRSKDRNKEREPKREGILSRVGVQSKISVIKKPTANQQQQPSDEEEEDLVVREVQSSIKVKPRVFSNHMAQPNKNLLLKAVAEAQRSIAQTPKVGKDIAPKQKDTKPRGIKKVKNIIKQSSGSMRSRMEPSSDEYDSEGEYIPKPVKKTERDVPKYIPSSKSGSDSELRENETKENGKQQFIITLDGIERLGLVENKSSVKSRLNTSVKKRSPSPIVFENTKDSSTEIKASRPDLPNKLPVVQPPLSVKNKERCRYWPGCRQGDKCEFVHPSESCQMFPHCKFGEKCLFLHPKCKFGSSCTKRDCLYDHSITKNAISSKLLVASSATMQNCKFFPNCANAKCPFYHPKPCKYGKYCKNISECSFSHALVVSKKNMSWRSK